jgi:cytochrome c553
MMSYVANFAWWSTRIMIRQLKIVFLGILLSAAAPLAAADSVPVRNCTWCHGTSAQGFTIAPRLAGQRHQYIENQLLIPLPELIESRDLR